MSATRLRAGKLIMIAFFAWALGFAGPARAQDEPVKEWREFQEHHPEFDEHLPEFKGQTEALMDSWQQYLSYELIDGTGWQFHDNFHLANLTINGLKHDWGREFDRWRLMYDRRTIELVSLARRYSDVQLTRKINSAVESDRKVSLYFYGSSPTSNVIHVVYHQTQMPQQIKWETFIHLVPKEQVFERSFTIPRSKPGEYSLTFEVGEKPGIVTLTYISLRDVTEKHTERTTIARSMI